MEQRRVDHRRLRAVTVALAVASVICVGMVALQVDTAWTYKTQFLVWNLGLAWVPYLLALAVERGHRGGMGLSLLGVLCGCWLLFLPNAPYIATDVVHLRDPGVEVLWWDASMIAAFAVTGLVLGLCSVVIVQTVVAERWGHVAGWTCSMAALALSSVGIYLGRFAEVNSWDVVVAPGRVLEPFADRLAESPLHLRFMVLTTLVTGLLVLAYVTLYRVVSPRLLPRRH
jgi:uncharacterized membrane protein